MRAAVGLTWELEIPTYLKCFSSLSVCCTDSAGYLGHILSFSACYINCGLYAEALLLLDKPCNACRSMQCLQKHCVSLSAIVGLLIFDDTFTETAWPSGCSYLLCGSDLKSVSTSRCRKKTLGLRSSRFTSATRPTVWQMLTSDHLDQRPKGQC